MNGAAWMDCIDLCCGSWSSINRCIFVCSRRWCEREDQCKCDVTLVGWYGDDDWVGEKEGHAVIHECWGNERDVVEMVVMLLNYGADLSATTPVIRFPHHVMLWGWLFSCDVVMCCDRAAKQHCKSLLLIWQCHLATKQSLHKISIIDGSWSLSKREIWLGCFPGMLI